MSKTIVNPLAAAYVIDRNRRWMAIFVIVCIAETLVECTPNIINTDVPLLSFFVAMPVAVVVKNFISSLLMAFLLYGMTTISIHALPNKSFSRLFSMVVAAGTIEVLASFAGLAAGIMRWVVRREPALLKSSLLSLGDAMGDTILPPLLMTIANHVTVFSVWYIGVIAIFLSVAAETITWKSIAIAIFAWVCRLVMLWGSAKTAGALMHF
jgi:hypothetical protein